MISDQCGARGQIHWGGQAIRDGDVKDVTGGRGVIR